MKALHPPVVGTIRADYNGNTHTAESKDKPQAVNIKTYLIRMRHAQYLFLMSFVVRNTKAKIEHK